MFGYDDDELNSIIGATLADARVYVQMSLDRSQASGVHRKGDPGQSGTTTAFGNSIAMAPVRCHNAISHLKIVIRRRRVHG